MWTMKTLMKTETHFRKEFKKEFNPFQSPFQLAETFYSEVAIKQAKSRKRKLVREKNEAIKSVPHYVDIDLRWVKQEMAKIRAEEIEKEINYLKKYIYFAEIKLAEEQVKESREKGENGEVKRETVTSREEKNKPERLSELMIEEARGRNIKEVAESLGMKVKSDRVLCPYHNDHDESLYLSKKTNHAVCFVCEAKKDGIALVMDTLGYSFIQAVKFLNKF